MDTLKFSAQRGGSLCIGATRIDLALQLISKLGYPLQAKILTWIFYQLAVFAFK